MTAQRVTEGEAAAVTCANPLGGGRDVFNPTHAFQLPAIYLDAPSPLCRKQFGQQLPVGVEPAAGGGQVAEGYLLFDVHDSILLFLRPLHAHEAGWTPPHQVN